MNSKKLLFITLLMMAFLLAGCKKKTVSTSENATQASTEKRETVIVDTIERPEIITPEVIGGYINYPIKPEAAPVADETSVTSVKTYSVNGNYTAEETEDGYKVTYTGIEDYSYIYAEAENYSAKYGNIKIGLSTKGAEKIAVQAIYYEMYSEDMTAVTVYTGDLEDGDQYVVACLDKFKANNSIYEQVSSKSLENMTILGFIILIDSNPSQATLDDNGEATITEFKFLEDGDPELDVKYVAPHVNYTTSFGDSGYEVTYDSETGLHVNYEEIPIYSRVYLPIMSSSKDYCEFEIKFNTTGVKEYAIGVMYSVEGHENYQPYVELVRNTVCTDGEHTHTLNYDGVSPIDMSDNWNYVAGEYIKNYGVYQICIWFDSLDTSETTGSATIESVVFNRTASEGCNVGKAWSTTIQSITLNDDIVSGGTGSISYSYYSGWYYLAMPVSGYEPSTKLTIKVMGEIEYFGIELVAGGSAVTIYSGWDVLTPCDQTTDESASQAKGTVYTVTKDADGIYTLTFDFTNAKRSVLTQKQFIENTITSIRFYLGDPNSGNDGFSGNRTIKFLSVAFTDPVNYSDQE